jgi:hypothetical protein
MIDETTMADASELSPRAAIALMSLTLRSTIQEALDAEAEADAVDADAALWQLRSRLAPLIDDRRRALDEEVAAERERAAAQIAAAHAEADRMIAAAVDAAAARVAAEQAAAAEAEQAAAAEAERKAAAEAAPVPAEAATWIEPEVDEPEADTSLFDDPMVEWAADEPAEEPAPSRATVLMPAVHAVVPPPPPPLPRPTPTPPLPTLSPWAAPGVTHSEGPSMQVVIDAESFARVFAAAIAPALENRQPLQQQQAPTGWMPYQPPTPKKSFWSHAWHPDVLLSGLAMVIVIVVLVAWTG